MPRTLGVLLLLALGLTAVTAAPYSGRRGTPNQIEHLRHKLRALEGSLSEGEASNQDVDKLLQDFVDSLDPTDVRLLEDTPSKTPLLQRALHDHKDRPSPLEQGTYQTFAKRADDPLEDFLNSLTKDDRDLVNGYKSRLDLLEKALALPPAPAEPGNTQPTVPPSASPKPELLPIKPQPEQLPAKPQPEQLPAKPQPEVLPSSPKTEQVPLSTKPVQPSTPKPSQLPGQSKTGKRCVGGNCYKFEDDLVSFSKRSVRSGPLAEFLNELLEEDRDIANNIKAKLNFLRQAIGSSEEMEATHTALARRGSEEDLESYIRSLQPQDSDLLNKFQSRLHLVREALRLKPTKEDVRRSGGFGDFVAPELPEAKPSERWGEEPLPDQDLGIVEESRCIGGNCEVQKPVSESSRKMAAALLASSDTNPRLRALLERLRQERRHQ